MNDLYVWLRPTASVKPVEYDGCAKWLVKKGDFDNYTNAFNYLVYNEEHRPDQFRYLISEYHLATDYKEKVKTIYDRNPQGYYSVPGPYGDQPHMYTA
jgi:hypothetical protein